MQALLFSFKGRVNRAKYWLVVICAGVIEGIIFGILFGGMAASSDPTAALQSMGMISVIIGVIIYIVGLWIGLALAVKRCHDRNRSGWFVLLMLVPILNIWCLVELLFLKGTTGANTYGPDPLAAAV